MGKTPLKGDRGDMRRIVLSYLDKNLTMSSNALARLIYQDGGNCKVFKSQEAVRSIIRGLRGANGDKKRAQSKDLVEKYSKFYKKGGNKDVPKSITHFDDWKPVCLSAQRVLILSDIHIPYHNEQALQAACEWGKEKNPDLIILNGDALDVFSLSRWEKDPRERDLANEIKTAKEFWHYLRNLFPDIQIVYKIGNHEERYWKYMTDKSVELLGVDAFSFDQVFGTRKYEFDIVDGKRPIILNGEIAVIHGHEYYGSGGSVNPARGYTLKTKMNTVSAHLHRTLINLESAADGSRFNGYASGCLCDLNPGYSPNNDWNHGFVYVEKIRGKNRVHNLIIEDGEVL